MAQFPTRGKNTREANLAATHTDTASGDTRLGAILTAAMVAVDFFGRGLVKLPLMPANRDLVW